MTDQPDDPRDIRINMNAVVWFMLGAALVGFICALQMDTLTRERNAARAECVGP